MSEWRQTTIAHLLRFHRGITWSADQETEQPAPTDVPVLRIPNIRDNLDLRDVLFLRGISNREKRQFAARKDWILLVGSNGNPDRVGNCVIINHDSEYLFASFLVGAEVVDPSTDDPHFAYYLINGPELQKAITDSVQGSTGLRNINLSRFGQKRVQIPPKHEQRRIAEILTTVDQQIEKTDALIAKYQSIKQGMMEDLLVRRIDEKFTTLDQVAEIRCSNVDKNAHPSERRVLLCNYLDVYNNEYIARPAEFMAATATPNEVARFAVARGDVIITKDSETPDDIGVPTAVLDDIPNLVCGYHLALIKPYRDQIDPVFLAKQLASHRIVRYFSQTAKGTTRYGLSNGVVEKTEIWLPPLEQQRNIAEKLTTFDRKIEAEENHRDKLKAIKHGLMEDLLSGQVRVGEKQTEEALAHA